MRSFAVIPAAGRSQRMGQPKLLLSWQGRPIIRHVIDAWQSSRVTEIVVVVHPDDAELAQICRAAGVEVVVPETAPPQMKDSIQLALRHISRCHRPALEDAWLLAPADMPQLSATVIDQLLSEPRPTDATILVPYVGPERGHPVLFPWRLAAEVDQLAEHEGVNALLDRHGVRRVACTDGAILDDLDTPEDFQRLRRL